MREPTHAFRNRLFIKSRGLSADFGQMRQVRYRKPPSAAIRLTGDTVTVAVKVAPIARLPTVGWG